MPKPNQSKKPSKRGRPTLPKGDAKAIMLRVRITPDELTAVEAAAKNSKQTVSEWVRDLVKTAIQE
jgi:hypothetical protein